MSSPAVLLALVGGMMLLSSSGARASAPAKPKLPKPLGKPPTASSTAPKLVVPASPPRGGAVPGSVPKGAVKPGTPPPTAPLKPGEPRPEWLFPVDYPAEFTPLNPNPAPSSKAPSQLKTPVRKPLGQAVKRALASVAPTPGSVPASPVLETNRGAPTPPGYDPAKAKSRARALAAHLAKKGPAGYSRSEVKSWQQQAGLTPDGLYGGSSRGALIHFGVADPPRAFFAPIATLPYVPPEQR